MKKLIVMVSVLLMMTGCVPVNQPGSFANSKPYEYEDDAAINHLDVWMPITEAKDENDAKLKMSKIMEKAIRDAFLPPYKTRIEETWIPGSFGEKIIRRNIRIDGPKCENWSCIVYAPLPSENAQTLTGRMRKKNNVGESQSDKYVYKSSEILVFKKIKEEIRMPDRFLLKSEYHKAFDYNALYLRFSKGLPEWVFFYIAPKGKDNPELDDGPAMLNEGVKTKIGV